MFRKLLCVMLVGGILAFGQMAVAGTAAPIELDLSVRALGPQPEPPDYPVMFWNWMTEFFSGMF